MTNDYDFDYGAELEADDCDVVEGLSEEDFYDEAEIERFLTAQS